jgi:hypothetical protein
VKNNRSSHGYEELLVSLEPDIPQQDANFVLGSLYLFAYFLNYSIVQQSNTVPCLQL